MAAERKISTKLTFDGEKEYKEACKGINNSLKVLGSEMKVVTAQYGANDKSIEGLTARQNVLKKQYDEQTKKVGENEKALAALKAEENQNADAIARFEVALNNSKAALANTANELGKTEKELDGAGKEADQFGKEVKKAGDEADQSGGKLSKLGDMAASAGKAFGKGMLAIGTAAVGISSALVAATVSGSNFADDILTQATYTRQSTDDLQKYAYAARFVDVEMGTLTKSMTKNIKTMDSARGGTGAAAEAYKKLGVSVTNSDGSLRDSNDVYWETIDGLKGITNETERDALAMQLLGKSGTELNSVIEAGSEGFKAYGDEAIAMGAVMSGDQLNSLGAFNDKLQKLEVGMGGLKNAAASIALPFLDVLATEGIPILNDFAEKLKSGDSWVKPLANAMTGFIRYVIDNGDKIITLIAGIGTGLAVFNVAQMVMSLVKAFQAYKLVTEGATVAQWAMNLAMAANPVGLVIAAIAALVAGLIALFATNEDFRNSVIGAWNAVRDTCTKVWGYVADFFTVTIPNAFNAVIDFVKNNWQGLLLLIVNPFAGAFKLIYDNCEGFKTFVNTFIENVKQFFINGWNAIATFFATVVNFIAGMQIQIWNWLTKIVSDVVQWCKNLISTAQVEIPKFISTIVELIASLPQKFYDIGVNIVNGVWNGIQSMASWLWDKVTDFFSSIVDGVKDTLGIESPSKVFAGIGKYMAEGMGIGFAKEMRNVEKGIRKAIPTEFDTTSIVKGSRGITRGENSKPTVQVVQNIYTPQYDYVAQQREAAKQFKLIARQV